MSFLNPLSLGDTIERLTDCELGRVAIAPGERKVIARWIAGRTGQKRSYRGLPAPAEDDRHNIRLFTGERLTSGASISHVLGEEAARALLRLQVNDAEVAKAIAVSSAAARRFVDSWRQWNRPEGTYCCAKCSVALWRHLTAGPDAPGAGESLRGGLRYLASRRDKGRWKTFPFWYTLLALLDVDDPAAVRELAYAAPICERAVKRKTGGDVLARRRQKIAQRVLARV